MTAHMIKLGDLQISFVRKEVKNVHLSVYPPTGIVTLVAPSTTRPEVARAFAISKLGWIRKQQAKLDAQERETPRAFIEGESHQLWGRRYLLNIREEDTKPFVKLSPRTITLTVRPGSSGATRQAVMYEWRKRQLHDMAAVWIPKWERKLGVELSAYFVQRMKTQWGSCNHRAGTIRLNTELVKKPKDLVEYVVVHEMTHLLESTHNDRFVELMDRHWPQWRESRQELNELPLGHERWEGYAGPYARAL